MKNKSVRLVLEIELQLRYAIKRRALDRGMTLKNWVLVAIAEKIKNEDESCSESIESTNQELPYV